MVSTLCLLTCALAVGQVPDRGDWLLLPQLARGQELIYAGSFKEEALSPSVQFQRAFSIDTTVLVLETNDRQSKLAFLTVASPRNSANPQGPDTTTQQPWSVRLEVMPMDRQGKLQPASPATLIVPIEGPPTIECGIFREMPKVRVSANFPPWDVNEEGRTPWTWRIEGTETVNNVLCVRVSGVQQSDDWGTPRADRTAWQRRDTLWITPQNGVTIRYDRIVERRDAAREGPTHRSSLRCELTSGLTWEGKLFDDRKNEIEQARKLTQDADAWLRDVEKHKQQLEATLKRIKQFTDAEAPTPYRKAVMQVQKRIEAGLRGDTIPDPHVDLPLPIPKAALGQRMPDFVCSDLLTHQTHRLQRLLDKPVLVFFYNPATSTGMKALGFAQHISQRPANDVNILAMAVTEDEELVQRQHKEMKLTFPILDGNNMVGLFAVDATPRFVVLDKQGIVRGTWTGWGIQTAPEVSATLQKWMGK
jgi:peroxiredoxin